MSGCRVVAEPASILLYLRLEYLESFMTAHNLYGGEKAMTGKTTKSTMTYSTVCFVSLEGLYISVRP